MSPSKSKTIASEDVQTRHGNSSRWKRWGFRLIAAILIPALFLERSSLSATGGNRLPSQFPGAFRGPARLSHRQLQVCLAILSPCVGSQLSANPRRTRPRPPSTKRVIVFGGSAAMGDPEPAFGSPRVLQAMLELSYPEQEFEVINAAVTAVNSHVVLPIARDCRVLDADAMDRLHGQQRSRGTVRRQYSIRYVQGAPLWLTRAGTAVNRTKLGQLVSRPKTHRPMREFPKSWGGMKMFLDHQVHHEDPALAASLRPVRQEPRRCSRRRRLLEGTPVLVSTVVTNTRNCAPFTSQHRAVNLSERAGAMAEALMISGCAPLKPTVDTTKRSARLPGRQLEIDPQFAELQFRMGECFLKLGESIQARDRFNQARDDDSLRFRANSTINEIITSEAIERKDSGVHLIDARTHFDRLSPHGITGEELLCEHVHFTFAGNYILAKSFAEQLAVVWDLSNADDEWPSEQQIADRLGFTPYHRLLLARELRSRFRTPPFDTQLNHESRDARVEAEIADLASSLTPQMASAAVARYRELLEQHSTDWILREQFAALLESLGMIDEAIGQWSEVTKQLPHYAEAFYKLGSLLNRAKKREEAEQALRTTLTLRPDYARAWNSLGIALSHQQRIKEAYAQFAKAIELQPSFAEAHLNWGLVLANQGNVEEALKRYCDAVEADPNYLPAHVELGKHYSGRATVRGGRTLLSRRSTP